MVITGNNLSVTISVALRFVSNICYLIVSELSSSNKFRSFLLCFLFVFITLFYFCTLFFHGSRYTAALFLSIIQSDHLPLPPSKRTTPIYSLLPWLTPRTTNKSITAISRLYAPKKYELKTNKSLTN